MDLADVLSVLKDVGARGVDDSKVAFVVVAAVLGLTYLAIVGVALFHPDEKRRADACRILKMHRFTRKLRAEDRQEADEGVE